MNDKISSKGSSVYAEWRARPGNLKHVERFVPMLREQLQDLTEKISGY